jgi:hypothetical protein
MTKPASFTCPVCGAVSHHPVDAAEEYCGNCHDWTGKPCAFDYDGWCLTHRRYCSLAHHTPEKDPT